MFFYLSKLGFFFLQPLNWVIFLLIFWIITKNILLKKRILIALIIIALFFSNEFIHNELAFSLQKNESELVPNKQYEAGILLGGLSGYDKNKVAHFSSACDRFIQINKLYHQGIIKKIIVSSGSASILQNESGEANFLAEELIKSGVNPKDIFIENRSKNTYENASFSKRILDSLHLNGPFVLVSSAFHLPRASLVFKKAGFNVVAHPAAFEATARKYAFTDYFWPSIGVLGDWGKLIKELVGVAMYKCFGKA